MSTDQKYIDIVFDGPPAHESGRFIEVENPAGASIRVGEWVERVDGLWALRIPQLPTPNDRTAEAERILAEGQDAAHKAQAQARAGNPSRADNYGKKAHGCWMQAQAEATLALVEEQRTANLIAWTTANDSEPGVGMLNVIEKRLGL